MVPGRRPELHRQPGRRPRKAATRCSQAISSVASTSTSDASYFPPPYLLSCFALSQRERWMLALSLLSERGERFISVLCPRASFSSHAFFFILLYISIFEKERITKNRNDRSSPFFYINNIDWKYSSWTHGVDWIFRRHRHSVCESLCTRALGFFLIWISIRGTIQQQCIHIYTFVHICVYISRN